MSRPGRAVFLDRDGVLNVNLDAHVRSWSGDRGSAPLKQTSWTKRIHPMKSGHLAMSVNGTSR